MSIFALSLSKTISKILFSSRKETPSSKLRVIKKNKNQIKGPGSIVVDFPWAMRADLSQLKKNLTSIKCLCWKESQPQAGERGTSSLPSCLVWCAAPHIQPLLIKIFYQNLLLKPVRSEQPQNTSFPETWSRMIWLTNRWSLDLAIWIWSHRTFLTNSSATKNSNKDNKTKADWSKQRT